MKIGKIQGHGNMIQKEDFQAWLNVSLDLNAPKEVIPTRYGSLILDEAFSGRLYLKGLELEGKSSEKNFKFSYNFFRGDVNRDRERLSDPEQEAKMLAEI